MKNKVLSLALSIAICILFMPKITQAQVLEEIPNPEIFNCFEYSGGKNGNIYFEYTNGSNFPIFHYDENELQEVEIPTQNLFSIYGTKYNEIDYFLSASPQYEIELYQYDGNSTAEIPAPNGYSYYNLLTVYQNQILFSLSTAGFNLSMFSYDGNEFTQIPNPTGYTFGNYLTTWNDVMYLYYNDNNSGSSVFTFDGISLTEIGAPPNTSLPFTLSSNQDLLYLVFNDEYFNGIVFAYDGTDFIEIPNPVDYTFSQMEGKDENGIYVIYFDVIDFLYSKLYLLNGTSITEIEIPFAMNESTPQYYGTYDGTPYFAISNIYEDTNPLFFYDGASLQEVTSPQFVDVLFPIDTLNGNVYIACYEQYESTRLGILNTVTNEISLVANPPGASFFINHEGSYNSNLLLSFYNSNNQNELYIYDGINFTSIPNPENKRYDNYFIEDNDIAYLRYIEATGFEDVGTLYKLHMLNSSPISKNDTVSTFVDIPFEFISNNFSFSDADGDAFEGILITQEPMLGNLTLNGANVLENEFVNITDIPFLTFTPNAGEVGTPYTSFNFMVFDGTDYSDDEYAIFINVLPNPTSIENLIFEHNLNIYPNPANDAFTIKLNNNNISNTNNRIVIYNHLGQSIFDKRLENQTLNINTETWSTGIYWIKWFNNEQLYGSKKLIVLD